MSDLRGIYPPIPTPFTEDEKLDQQALRSNLEVWVDTPLAGVVTPGSNSELPHLERDEKEQLWRMCHAVLEPAGKHFIAGTGTDTTRTSIQLTIRAAELGARAALVLTPHFYTPLMTQDALMSHFTAIADQSPLDIILYNVPQFTGVVLQPSTVLALADHPRITGIKDSSANLVNMIRVLSRKPDFQVFSGSGGALLPFITMGAVGGIMALANIAPHPLQQMMHDVQAGNMDRARKTQLRLADLNTAITAKYGIPGLKHAMDQLGLIGGASRRPLQPLSPQARINIEDLISKANLKPLI